MCVYVCVVLGLSSLRKQDQAPPPFTSLLKAICFAILSVADDFFVRLDWGPEGHERSRDQHLNENKAVTFSFGCALELPGSFKNYWYLDPTPRDSDLMGLENASASGFLKVPQAILMCSLG